jgi:hypothetical protein
MLPKTAFKYEDERWIRRPHDRKDLETATGSRTGLKQLSGLQPHLAKAKFKKCIL